MKAKPQIQMTSYETLQQTLIEKGFKCIGEYNVSRSFVVSGYESWVDNSTNPRTYYTLEVFTNGEANLYKQIDL